VAISNSLNAGPMPSSRPLRSSGTASIAAVSLRRGPRTAHAQWSRLWLAFGHRRHRDARVAAALVRDATRSPDPPQRRRRNADRRSQSRANDGNAAAAASPDEAEATEILWRRGYIDISNPAAQPDGSWTAEAAKEFGGSKIRVIVDRNGHVEERAAAE